MLYFPEADLAFMHVPKNAGKSVRRALVQVTPPSHAAFARDLGVPLDKAEAIMAGTGTDLPELGTVKPEHLPLPLIARHFPQTFAQIRAARSVMLVRSPRDRFFSALLQRLREFKGNPALRADDPLVQEEALRVCAWLEGRGTFHEMPYIHFARQVDYAEVSGKRVVTALFPVERTDAMARWIGAQTGLSIDIPHEHVRREPRRWARRLQPCVRRAGRRVLPSALRRALYPYWVKSAVFSDAANRYQEIRLDMQTEQFLANYYAADARLYAEAQRFAKEVDLAQKPLF